MKQYNIESISKLLDIMRRLRDPQAGCPWDCAQTFETIAPYTIEEAYEVADVIERGAARELCGELGDLLFQVVFHARLAEEAELFDFSDVAAAISAKLVRRHPHVFAGQKNPQDQNADWEAHKRAEREAAGHARVLSGIPAGLPALTRAAKLGKRAAGVGFDWPDASGARAKVDEELEELDEACRHGSAPAIEAEVGDVLFALSNLCRHLHVDPERALRASSRRFEQRFGGVEARVAAAGREWTDHSLEELDAYWEQVKAVAQDSS
jgi:MazG family protein